MTTVVCPQCKHIYQERDADYLLHLRHHVETGELIVWRWEFDDPRLERFSTPERVQSAINRYGKERVVIVSKIDTTKGDKNGRNHR